MLGTGYGWVQLALSRAGLLHLPLLLVLALPFARIAATGLSIGSGGSGGIFGPGMVIGAFTGAALWRLLEPLGHGVPHSPAPFVVVAMTACFGSICRAPLAIMLMVAEMTGSLAILAPAMIAVGIATLIVTRADATIYRSQLRSRADSPAHRLQAGLPLLSGVTVTEVMAAPRLVLDYRRHARDALGALRSAGLPGAPVSGHRGVFVGIVTTAGLAGLDHRASGRRLDRVVDVTAPSVRCGAAAVLADLLTGAASARAPACHDEAACQDPTGAP